MQDIRDLFCIHIDGMDSMHVGFTYTLKQHKTETDRKDCRLFLSFEYECFVAGISSIESKTVQSTSSPSQKETQWTNTEGMVENEAEVTEKWNGRGKRLGFIWTWLNFLSSKRRKHAYTPKRTNKYKGRKICSIKTPSQTENLLPDIV